MQCFDPGIRESVFFWFDYVLSTFPQFIALLSSPFSRVHNFTTFQLFFFSFFFFEFRLRVSSFNLGSRERSETLIDFNCIDRSQKNTTLSVQSWVGKMKYLLQGQVLIHFLNPIRIMCSVQATQSIIRLVKQVYVNFCWSY